MNDEPSITPISRVGARVPIHFATAMIKDCHLGPRRATNIAMKSPDISRFCTNAEYRAA